MIKNIVFDIGRVLIWWDVKILYKEVFATEEDMNNFFDTISFFDWNLSMDAGKPFAVGVKEKQEQFPQYAKEIAMFDEYWEKTAPYYLEEPVRVLKELKEKNYNLYALTNFSSEKFALSKKRFDFLNIFDGTVVSAEEKLVKPNPDIFLLLCKRYNFIPEESVFIDDSEANIKTAKELGFKTILFKYPDLLRPQLKTLGINI